MCHWWVGGVLINPKNLVIHIKVLELCRRTERKDPSRSVETRGEDPDEIFDHWEGQANPQILEPLHLLTLPVNILHLLSASHSNRDKIRKRNRDFFLPKMQVCEWSEI